MIQKTALNDLINTFRQKDYTLWQILTTIAGANEDLRKAVNLLTSAFDWHEEFILPTVATGTDKLTYHRRVYLPRDSQGNVLYKSIRPKFVGITAKTAPSGADFIGDILYTRDDGTNWASLFKTTNPLTLPDGRFFIGLGEFSVGTLVENDKLRLDVSQTGSAVGLEIELFGDYVS